jgi:GTPase SAR1 family protein
MTNIQMEQLTTENLDRVARSLQADAMPSPDKQRQWDEEFKRKMHALIDMFEDGPEVILQCKVADQFTRVFEKIAHNIVAAGTQAKRELRDLKRDDVGIEITGNKIEDQENKIELLRQQYWIANHAYKIMRHQVRSEVIGKTGMNWGQYIPADEMSRVKRVNFRKGQLTMEQYQANKQDFWSYARDAGLVEMPRDDGFASNT